MAKLHYNWKYKFLHPTEREIIARYNAKFRPSVVARMQQATAAATAAATATATATATANGAAAVAAPAPAAAGPSGAEADA